MTTESTKNEIKAKQDEGFLSGLSPFSLLKNPFPAVKALTMRKIFHPERYGVFYGVLPDGHTIRRVLHLGPQPKPSTKEQAPVAAYQDEKEAQEEAHVPRLGRMPESEHHRRDNVLRDGSSDFISTLRQIHPGFWVLILLLVPVPLTAAALIFLWLSQVMIVLRERMKPHNEEIVLPRSGLSYLGYAYVLTMGREQHDKPPEH